MSSKNERKRKREVDTSTSAEDNERERTHHRSHDRSSSRRESTTRRSSRRHERDATSPPSKAARESGNDVDGGGAGGREESLSIDETNKLRAQLGLAPLDVDGSAAAAAAVANRPDIVLGEGESLFTEDGVAIIHKAARNLISEKTSAKVKERLETAKQKRQIESRVLKVNRGLADESDGEDSASAWVERSRRLEAERLKAEEKAKQLDELDEAFGVSGFIENEKRIMKRKQQRNANETLNTAGLIVGHSKEAFTDGQSTVLVLKDKSVLDADDDEVLINPNLLENERHKRNVELRKKKGAYNPYEDNESIDQFGQITKKDILDKYDEVLDGDEAKREKFRLDATGGYDLEREAHEAEMRRRLMMANKRFETLDVVRPTLAREFYTEEEMISFRRPKKKKDKLRKRGTKTLRASDLLPDDTPADAGETEAERQLRAEKLAARRGETTKIGVQSASNTDEMKAQQVTLLEDGELAEEDAPTADHHDRLPPKAKWKNTAGASVDLEKLRQFAEGGTKQRSPKKKLSAFIEAKEQMELENNNDEEEELSEDDLVGGVNLMGVMLEDDAEEELRMALERTRRLKQVKTETTNGDEHLTGVERVRALLSAAVKDEVMDVNENENADEHKIVFDATSEQYKTVGEVPTLGLAGNREDGVDYSSLLAEADEEARQRAAANLKARRRRASSSSDAGDQSDRDTSVVEDRRLRTKSDKSKRSSWKENGHHKDESMNVDDVSDAPASSSHHRKRIKTETSRKKTKSLASFSGEDDDDDEDYENVLGEEKDVSKGVAAMLKLAAVKGYLEGDSGRRAGDGTLKHLESKRFSRVEQGRYDIEDKTMRKLERMGTTGTGPVRAFPEKVDYKPDVEVSYSDSKGRLMGEKEAFRALSHKFHGKGPGKKQIEKHQAQLEKKERLKKMNSMDTPLGTLTKQRKKQEQLQTPYLILSGTAKDGAPLQKD